MNGRASMYPRGAEGRPERTILDIEADRRACSPIQHLLNNPNTTADEEERIVREYFRQAHVPGDETVGSPENALGVNAVMAFNRLIERLRVARRRARHA